MKALEKLRKRTADGFHICVGLDTDLERIPEFLLKLDDPIYEFNRLIIERTKDAAAAYKLNLAFYEAQGIKGLKALEKTLADIPGDILIIGDAKRGDIGNTARMYAKALFDELGFDASTLNPLMGFDSLFPFFEYGDKINFVLGLTSNKGAEDFEKLRLENGKPLFVEIIEKVKSWSDTVGLVFGATNSEELRRHINLISDVPVLLPGVGAQGGSLDEIVKIFYGNNSKDFLINISRSLIYFDSGENFAYRVGERLSELNAAVQKNITGNGETN